MKKMERINCDHFTNLIYLFYYEKSKPSKNLIYFVEIIEEF